MTVTTAQATAAKIERAKGRLYVLCQAAGWGVFLVSQFVFARAFTDPQKFRAPDDQLTDQAIILMIVAMGLLITHYARPLMTRWGWKQMSWRALAPRIFVMAVAMSVLWSAVGYGYVYAVLQMPWTSKFSKGLIFSISCLNGTAMFVGWLCIYFFYHVFEQLNRLRFDQLQLVATAKEAELRALKSQVNPHFLFNSLNSLRALIDEDAPRAREAVTRLANMLRYSLQSGALETVPLEEELRTVEDYLALESIRHEERLRVQWSIAPETRSINVPPMLLQTLVENAVKYGISPRREGGEIGVCAKIIEGVLRIRVTNPGDLNAPTSAAAARAGSSTGVGLRNASERLELLFGGRAKLVVRAEPVGCVTADVHIPLAHVP